MNIDAEELQTQEQEPQEPIERQVHRLPDADVLNIAGGVYEWTDTDGIEKTQARCSIILGSDQVEHFKSHVFVLRRDCDPVGQDSTDNHMYPVRNMTVQYQSEIVAAAAIARSGMDWQTERSPQDMLRELSEIRGDAAQRIRQYELHQQELRKQAEYDTKAIETYELAKRGEELSKRLQAS